MALHWSKRNVMLDIGDDGKGFERLVRDDTREKKRKTQ